MVELHLHLDGSVRIGTMLDIAAHDRTLLPATGEAELKRALRCGQVRLDLADYLEAFALTTSVMQTRSALGRIASELLEDVSADGLRYVEIRFMPELHTLRGLAGEEVMEAVLDGLLLGGRKHDVAWGLIVCSMRHVAPEVTGRMIDLALAYQKHGVVAVDLAGDDNHRALDHAAHFMRAKEGGLRVTIHAAEEGPPQRAREAVELFGAERIGHGVTLRSDSNTLNMLIERGIGIEACLTSNVQTRTVRGYDAHPAREFLQKGARVSLSTDNRVLAGTTMLSEFVHAAHHWGLRESELRQLVRNAVETSFAPTHVKESLRHQIG
ncbi:MAG: adenosine deaminase [Patescibacteria group bacterium]